MSYLVLARKWRPQTFRDLIGQEHVSQTLKNAIESGRVAHAFLFTGARGVGKTSSARILAKALNCEQGPTTEPCNVCPACMEITAGASVDVFEIDGASNTGVDDIRELRETVKYLPARCRYKIFIIDEVHMLSTSAFNALLKTLEEPPAHIKFIFATTEPHKLPITILSRCQRFDFKRIPLPLVVARLRHIVEQERVTITDSGLGMIARKGDGSMRDSLSVLDQVLAFCGDQVRDEEIVTLLGVVDRRLLVEASQAVFARDCRTALAIVTRVDSFGYNMRQFCQELIDHFRNMTILKAVGAGADLPDLAETERAELHEQSATVELSDLQRHLAILLKAEGAMAHTSFPRLTLEMALIKMATLVPVVPVQEILDRMRALERAGDGGRVASPVPRWEKSPDGRSGVSSPETTRPTPARPAPSPPPGQSPQRRESGAAPPVAQDREVARDDWEGFVAFVKGKKPRLGAALDHGRPLRVSARSLEIGFPAGSFQLTSLQDAASLAELQGLAKAFFRTEAAVKLVSLAADGGGLPLSLSEKKSREKESRRLELHQAATGHPLVAAALEIFGGEITEISEADKTEN